MSINLGRKFSFGSLGTRLKFIKLIVEIVLSKNVKYDLISLSKNWFPIKQFIIKSITNGIVRPLKALIGLIQMYRYH